VVACPGCGRTTSSYFQELAQSIQSHIRTRMPQWRREYAGVEDMTVAVMGCVVNGPGESRLANIGISLPGTGERAVAPVYEVGYNYCRVTFTTHATRGLSENDFVCAAKVDLIPLS